MVHEVLKADLPLCCVNLAEEAEKERSSRESSELEEPEEVDGVFASLSFSSFCNLG